MRRAWQEQDYSRWSSGVLSAVGFFGSYAGRHFDGGFARDPSGKRDIYNERVRNAKKQSPELAGIHFICAGYDEVHLDGVHEPCMFYCDPPYRGTKVYSTADRYFDYDAFYDWCRDMAASHFLLISEYSMPADFRCVWEKPLKQMLRPGRKSASVTTEKLFTPAGGLYDRWLCSKLTRNKENLCL